MIQLQVLNKVLDTGDASLITFNNLDKSFFSDYEGEFLFIKSHLDRYGNIPDKATFLNSFPQFDILEVKETNTYLLDALYEDRNKRILAESFNKVRSALMEDNLDKALELYRNNFENLVTAKHLECVDIIQDTSRYDRYVERTTDFTKFFIKTGLAELDESINGGWDRGEELATIVARPGVGKCLAKGTKVLMADGTLKCIEDIVVGDEVQSQYTNNRVLGLHSGRSKGYKIVPDNGLTFTISSDHILTLLYEDELVDITIEDYLTLPKCQQNKYKLYRGIHKYQLDDNTYMSLGDESTFIVEEVAEIEYYGFMCDGDHRFMLEDGTLTHNSWLLLKTAVAAAQQGLTVGLYSGEMSEDKVGFRMDTLAGHISNTKILRGNADIMVEYKKYLENIKDTIKGSLKIITPAMINGIAGVQALRAFIEKENLDMLCVDQYSLLEDDKHAKNQSEQTANIAKDLKALQTLKKIPIIAVSQQNRESTENGVGTENVALSDKVSQYATILIFLEQKDDVLTVYLGKVRDSRVGKTLKYAINLDKGIFDFIPEEVDATNGRHCEDVKNEYEDMSTEGEEAPF